MILQLAKSRSAVTQILPLAGKNPQKKILGATVRDQHPQARREHTKILLGASVSCWSGPDAQPPKLVWAAGVDSP